MKQTATKSDWRSWNPSRTYPRLTKEQRAEKRAACKQAVLDLHEAEVARARSVSTLGYYKGITAEQVARRLGVEPAQRHGNGAVGGSWSGHMKPGLRVTRTLQSLVKDGELGGEYRTRDDDYRWRFWPPGREPWVEMLEDHK